MTTLRKIREFLEDHCYLQALILLVIVVVLCVWSKSSYAEGGIVGVAQCTIAARESMPVGPELDKRVKACYSILPKTVGQKLYEAQYNQRDHHSSEVRVVIEVRCGPRSRVAGTYPLTRC